MGFKQMENVLIIGVSKVLAHHWKKTDSVLGY